MKATEFLPDVQEILERRDKPACRLEQAYSVLTVSPVRAWEEATNKRLRAAEHLQGRPAISLR